VSSTNISCGSRVKLTDTDPVVDWDLVERARYAAGLKGYAVVRIMPTSVQSVLVTGGRWTNLVGIIQAP